MGYNTFNWSPGDFTQYLWKNEDKIKRDILDCTAGWIPTEKPRHIVRDNIILVGDAAGQTHPISGAGIAQAVMSGLMAGKWVARAVRDGDTNILSEYEKEWQDLYGESQEKAYRKRELMEREWEKLDSIIQKCWIGFKKYFV